MQNILWFNESQILALFEVHFFLKQFRNSDTSMSMLHLEKGGRISYDRSLHKRAFDLLGGVNQGQGLLLARGLEKKLPVALVNTLEKIECSLNYIQTLLTKLSPKLSCNKRC